MEQHQHADALPDSAQRVANLLSELKHDKPVVMLPSAGRTSAEAAAGLGCSVAEIAKSIIFRRLSDDAPVLVIASGSNRVDEAKVAAQVGALGKADAKLVREKTGYVIGGVCPIGHAAGSGFVPLRQCVGSGGTSACRLQSDGAAIAGDDRCAGDRCRLGPRRSG